MMELQPALTGISGVFTDGQKAMRGVIAPLSQVKTQ